MIIKSANDLRDPFITFCLFMKWMAEVEEDYLDYFCDITRAGPMVAWLQGKGYIKNETADDLFDDIPLTLDKVLQEKHLFPKTHGTSGLGLHKSYALLAEYISQFKLTRERVYKSVYSAPFYSDDNGVSLACVIEDDQLECTPNILNFIAGSDYDLQTLTYKELYTLATSKTIEECDSFV